MLAAAAQTCWRNRPQLGFDPSFTKQHPTPQDGPWLKVARLRVRRTRHGKVKMEGNFNTLESTMKENSNQNAEVMGEIKAAVCLRPPTLSNASSFNINIADLFDDAFPAASSPAPSLPSLGGSPSLPFLSGYLSLPSMGGCPSPPTASSPPTA